MVAAQSSMSVSNSLSVEQLQDLSPDEIPDWKLASVGFSFDCSWQERQIEPFDVDGISLWLIYMRDFF